MVSRSSTQVLEVRIERLKKEQGEEQKEEQEQYKKKEQEQ